MFQLRTLQKSKRKSRRGTVLILVAICLVVLMTVAALSLDGGRMLAERRQVQAASDSAADAGALELYESSSGGISATEKAQAVQQALAVAAANGYANDGVHSTVQVNIPPLAGSFAGRDGYVEVVIDAKLSRSFSAIFASGQLNIEGRTVAAGTQVDTFGSVLVLDPKKKHAAKFKSKKSSLELAGDLIINSKHKKALKLDRKFQIKADHILVAGGVERKVRNAAGKMLHTGVEPTPDPLAGLPRPSKGPTLDVKNFVTGPKDHEIYHLTPGTYKKLKFDHDQTVLLDPGVYYLEDGLSLKGNANLIGEGVTLFMADKKELKLHTKGDVHLTPPESGTYEGISIFVNPDKKSKVTFKKDTQLDINGIIYAPNAAVAFKKIDATLGGYLNETDDASDSETDDDEADDDDDSEPLTHGSLGAAIIARTLSIDKGSHVKITGVNINAKRPLLGIVE